MGKISDFISKNGEELEENFEEIGISLLFFLYWTFDVDLTDKSNGEFSFSWTIESVSFWWGFWLEKHSSRLRQNKQASSGLKSTGTCSSTRKEKWACLRKKFFSVFYHRFDRVTGYQNPDDFLRWFLSLERKRSSSFVSLKFSLPICNKMFFVHLLNSRRMSFRSCWHRAEQHFDI